MVVSTHGRSRESQTRRGVRCVRRYYRSSSWLWPLAVWDSTTHRDHGSSTSFIVVRYARIVAVSWPAGPFVRAIRNSRLRCGLRTSTCPRWTLGPDYPSVSRATVGTRGPATCVHVRTTAFRPRPPDPCGLGPGDTTWTSRDAGPDLQSEHRSAAGHVVYPASRRNPGSRTVQASLY